MIARQVDCDIATASTPHRGLFGQRIEILKPSKRDSATLVGIALQ
jgi:hypothetical protein